MGYPVCSGFLQNHIYRFDDDGNAYRYNNETTQVEDKVIPISKEKYFIKQCAYNGVDTIFFIGNTTQETESSIFSAVLHSNNTFDIKHLQDIIDIDETTTIISSSTRNGCVMLGSNTNHLERVCLDRVATDNTSNIPIVENGFILKNENFLYLLKPEGILGHTIDFEGSSAKHLNPSKLYKFEGSNIVNSTVKWKITTSTDTSQVLFYNSDPTVHLIKVLYSHIHIRFVCIMYSFSHFFFFSVKA